MIYLFDTNIILHYLRESDVMRLVEKKYQPFDDGNESWVSIISFGELRSLAVQNLAATTSILGATLLTTDADFDHLNGVFLNVGKVSV